MLRVGLIAAVLACGCQFEITSFVLDLSGDGADMAKAPMCSDGVKDGNESDVDCGKGCTLCGVGKSCNTGGDCATGACSGGKCAAPSCSNMVKDGDESDVDCGGSCPPCPAGKMCGAPADCVKNATCTGKVCTCMTGYIGAQCQVPLSCFDLQSRGQNVSGVALIDPDGDGPNPPFNVYCEMQKEGGGWTRLVRHVASAGFFGTDAAGRANNVNDPTNDLYSILGMVDQFARSGSYELMYWNRDGDKFVHTTQTWSPLDQTTAGTCPATGFVLVNSDFTPSLLCGFTPGPATWAVVNGNGPNWVYAAAQLMPYSSYPLVCTDPDVERCNWIEFYVR